MDYLVDFKHGRISDRYPGPFSAYLRLRQQANSATAAAAGEPKAAKPTPGDGELRPRARPRKLTWSEQQELAQLEARLEALESERRELQRQINRSGDDYRQLQALAGQLQTVEAELETISERWLELAEVAEGTP